MSDKGGVHLEKFLKRKHVWIVFVYGIFYMLCFGILEKRITRGYHVIHMDIDDLIPFCEVFIIPYVLWFLYMAAVVIFFAFINKDVKEYYQAIFSLGIGMTIFLITSWLYPNGQNLRPMVFTRDNIFIQMVRYLYAIDTPTNILPSIHVFNSVASYIAISHCQSLRKYRKLKKGALILTILIVLSTMFLKQHSVFDVLLALGLNAVVYSIIYQQKEQLQESRGKIRSKLLEH